MKKATKKTVKEEKAVATINGYGMDTDLDSPPDHIKQESVDVPSDDFSMFPTLKLMQSLSPEVDPEDEKHEPGAEPGDLIVTGAEGNVLLDGKEGMYFVPMMVRKLYTEWIPRKQGGGFVASYNSKMEAEQNFTPGNDLVVSIEYLCGTKDLSESGKLDVFLLQFNTPTKMIHARNMAKWIKKHGTLSGVFYKLTSKRQKNKAGQVFFNYDINPAGWTEIGIYEAIEKLQDDMKDEFLPELTGPVEEEF